MPDVFRSSAVPELSSTLTESRLLMRRIHAEVLPRARERLRMSDERLNESTGVELTSAQRLNDVPD